MKGQDIMQMLEHNQRLDCPEKCPPPVYDTLISCWAWRYTYRMLMSYFIPAIGEGNCYLVVGS